jgi:hypothetical protein
MNIDINAASSAHPTPDESPSCTLIRGELQQQHQLDGRVLIAEGATVTIAEEERCRELSVAGTLRSETEASKVVTGLLRVSRSGVVESARCPNFGRPGAVGRRGAEREPTDGNGPPLRDHTEHGRLWQACPGRGAQQAPQRSGAHVDAGVRRSCNGHCRLRTLIL